MVGDMAEVGMDADKVHREVGRRLAEAGIDILFAVGAMAYCYAGSARDADMRVVSEFDNVTDAGVALVKALRAGDLVLIKASRAARLEKISMMLRGQNGAEQSSDDHEQNPNNKKPVAEIGG